MADKCLSIQTHPTHFSLVSQEPLASRNTTGLASPCPTYYRNQRLQGPQDFKALSLSSSSVNTEEKSATSHPSLQIRTPEKEQALSAQSRPRPTSVAHTTSRCLSACCPGPREALNLHTESEPRTRGFPDSGPGNKYRRELLAD